MAKFRDSLLYELSHGTSIGGSNHLHAQSSDEEDDEDTDDNSDDALKRLQDDLDNDSDDAFQDAFPGNKDSIFKHMTLNLRCQNISEDTCQYSLAAFVLADYFFVSSLDGRIIKFILEFWSEGSFPRT